MKANLILIIVIMLVVINGIGNYMDLPNKYDLWLSTLMILCYLDEK